MKTLIFHILIIALMISFVSGCGTARSGQKQELQILKSRVAQLESEVQLRDKRQKELERLLDQETKIRRNLEGGTPAEYIDKGQSPVSTMQIQLSLKNAGFDPGPIDGKMGPKTKNAVIAFQKKNNLVPDGIVGSKTWAELKSYSEE